MQRTIALLSLFLTVLWSATNYAAASAANQTVLHFPDRSSLGELYLESDQYPDEPNGAVHPGSYFGKANGLISVPKRAKLLLVLAGDAAAQHPSLLTANGPCAFAGVDFGSVKADDEAMAKIGQLTGLQALQLNGTNISSNGLKTIQNCRSLRSLGLDRAMISSDGLRSIQKCGNLQFLSIACCNITDAGLRLLTTLSELRDLRLNGNTRVTAKGVLQLTGLKKLQALRIRQTGVTAKDLPVIQELSRKVPSLNCIVLEDRSFTSAEVRRWHRALPHVTLTVAEAAKPTVVNDERTLHFPNGASLGELYSFLPDLESYMNYMKFQHKAGEARGAVRVPKKGCLFLKVGYAAARDPSLLTAYGPDFFTALDFSRLETTDTTVAKISALSGLHALVLPESDLSDQAMRSLSKLKKLEYLNLAHAAITDQGLQWLLPLRSLKELCLDGTKVSDNGLRSIQKCRSLQQLGLAGCDITDAGLPALANLPDLTDLDLSSNTRITAKGLLPLAGMKKLRGVAVRGTAVTAKDLQVIQKLSQKLPSLNTISVSGRSFSTAAVAQWQRALPRISIELRRKTTSEEDVDAKVFAPLHSWSSP